MSILKKGIAFLLSAMLVLPTIPVSAAEVHNSKAAASQNETLSYNLGSGEIVLLSQNNKKMTWDKLTDGDDVYVIEAEQDAFFPYEVQFTYNGKTTKEWFMSQDDIVEIGDYQFGIHSDVTGTMVTEMTLDVAGKEVTVYPKEKEFISGKRQLRSLMPLEEKSFTVDLTGFTPVELTRVSLASVFAGQDEIDQEKAKVSFKRLYYDDDYEFADFSDDSDFNLHGYTGSVRWEMIVGTVDQLDLGNVRYFVTARIPYPYSWLSANVYKQSEEGKRSLVEDISCNYSTYSSNDFDLLFISIPKNLSSNKNIYFSLQLDNQYVGKTIKAYEGKCITEAEVNAAEDITDQIFSADMTEKDAGYLLEDGYDHYMTLVSFDGSKITGIRPVQIRRSYVSLKLDFQGIYKDNEQVSYTRSLMKENDVSITDYELKKGYSADSEYGTYAGYYVNGNLKNSKVTAAYVGTYNTIAEAKADDAVDVTSALFDSKTKYKANFKNGVYFTIFVGEDGSDDREVYHEWVKVTENPDTDDPDDPDDPDNPDNPDMDDVTESIYNGTAVTFDRLVDANGKSVKAYCVQKKYDSYGNNNFSTFLVEDDVDITSLAPVFYTSEGVKLYADTNTPEESGKTVHDFSKGILQYTASAGNKSDSANYWLQVVKQSEGAGKLYMSSLAHDSAETKTENGVVYSTREMMIDSLHNYRHDILLANIGTEKIDKLGVELTSDTVELDKYWTLSGNQDLSGFSTVDKTKTYGELANLARLRIKKKDGATEGSDITGTLTIKSAGTPLMVITLTGTVGNPCITTNEVPSAVKYVPYGTMIQNSNMYSWNKTTYEFVSGKLPSGMELMKNGELYGVPKEAGTFTFIVKMKNSYSGFSDSVKQLTLTVLDNTDTNVNEATDDGYDVTTRIEDISATDTAESYLFVSQGEFNEFTDVYLDGDKLAKDTDYSAESGSTRITIKSQTIKKLGGGTHTLGVEFRTGANREQVKRAAQNVKVKTSNSVNNPGNEWGNTTTNVPGNTSNDNTGTKKPEDKTDQTTTKPSEPEENSDLQNAVQASKRVVTKKQVNNSRKKVVNWLDKSGKTIKNSFVVTLKGNLVYVDKKGVMKQGIGFTVNGKRYYASKSGAIVKNGFFETERGNTVYATKSGVLKVKTAFKVKGKQYVAKKSGALVKDKWYTVGGKKYYCNKNGVVKDIKE